MLAKLPLRASTADVFYAIRPCVRFAAGLFGIIRPSAPGAMVACPIDLPPPVFASWLGTPHDQLALTLEPIIEAEAGGLRRDSETLKGPLRERLEVLHKLRADGLGEGAGYKVLARASPWYGTEHLLLAFLMERGDPIPPPAEDMLAALNPAISEAILRIELPFVEGVSVLAQMHAEQATGYMCLSRHGAVLQANRRAHDLVMRFGDAARVERGRSAVADFAARARETAGGARAWHLWACDPPSRLHVSVLRLPKETYGLPDDVHLVQMNEELLSTPDADELMERAGLTPQQKRIALILAHSSSVCKVIAAGLPCSPNTLRTHIQAIYRKLCVRSRLELREKLVN